MWVSHSVYSRCKRKQVDRMPAFATTFFNKRAKNQIIRLIWCAPGKTEMVQFIRVVFFSFLASLLERKTSFQQKRYSETWIKQSRSEKRTHTQKKEEKNRASNEQKGQRRRWRQKKKQNEKHIQQQQQQQQKMLGSAECDPQNTTTTHTHGHTTQTH